MVKHPAYFRGKQVSATSQGCAQGISGQYGADGLQRNDHPSFFGYGDHFYQLLIFQRSADRDRLPQDHKRDLQKKGGKRHDRPEQSDLWGISGNEKDFVGGTVIL